MDIEAMRYALERAAEQFEFYRESHAAKGTEDGDRKAAVNAQMLEMCLDALKPSDSIMKVVSEDVRPEPEAYVESLEQDSDKLLQNYKQAADLELANKIVNLVAPHWNKGVRQAAADSVRLVLRKELTRFWLDIVQFHHKYHLDYAGPPRTLPTELADFRIKFMQEELDEYSRTMDRIKAEGDTPELRADLLDALVDLVYVALGTAYLHGFNFAEAWRRVQNANMAKVRAERKDQSKRGSTFDVVKPEGWQAPNHLDLVGSQHAIVYSEAVKAHELF